MVWKHTLHFLFLTFLYFLAFPVLILLLPQVLFSILSLFQRVYIILWLLFYSLASSVLLYLFSFFQVGVGTASADFLICLFPPACLFLLPNYPSLTSFFVHSLWLSPLLFSFGSHSCELVLTLHALILCVNRPSYMTLSTEEGQNFRKRSHLGISALRLFICNAHV